MNLNGLDHFTVVCRDLTKSNEFYQEVLGLKCGDRPEFDFPGAWMYLSARPIVHLVGGRTLMTEETGPFEHIAFAASNLDKWRAFLRDRDISFEEADVPGRPMRQVFLHDPNGVKIELNFLI